MRLTLVFIFLVGTACASRQNGAPLASPNQTNGSEAQPERARPADVSAKVVAISEENRVLARQRLEQGREVQKSKGEAGAEEALILYQQALALDPELADALWESGWSLQVLERYSEALQAWDDLRALDPKYPELETYYPVLEMRLEQQRKLGLLPDSSEWLEPELEPVDGPVVKFAAVGDVQTGRGWPEHRAVLPPDGARGYFDAVKDWLQGADVTFGNLEQVLADGGESSKCGPKSTKCYSFRVPTAHAVMLADAGFDMMSIANNHAGDFGQEGRSTTMQTLDEQGIVYSGPVGVTASTSVKGLKIGMVAFSTGGGTYQIQRIETAKKVVTDLARRHDIVVVSFHGGAEGAKANHVPKTIERFYGENRGDVYAFAHAVVDAGADLVFGHGPHCLRGAEVYKSRFISYSLGNFSSYKTFNLSRNLGWSTVLNVSIAPNGVALSAKINPVIIRDPGRPTKDKDRRAISEIRRLSNDDFGDALFSEDGEWQRSAQGVAQR